MTGTASDNPGGSGVRDVRVRVDSGAYAAATPAAPGNWSTWSRTVSITTEGAHTISVNCRDNADNFRTIGVNITVSSAPPAPDTTIPNVVLQVLPLVPHFLLAILQLQVQHLTILVEVE